MLWPFNKWDLVRFSTFQNLMAKMTHYSMFMTIFLDWKLVVTEICAEHHRWLFEMWKKKNIKDFLCMLSLPGFPSRLATVFLVVPFDLLAAECRGCGLHLGSARALQRGRGRGLFHHLPTLLVVPHHGQLTGVNPTLPCVTVTVSPN